MEKQPKKRGRPAEDQRKVHTAITIDRWVLNALKGSPLGVSGEIRRRLELTSGDAETLRLLEAVSAAAVLTSLQTGHKWHAHPAAHRVLRQIILSHLARFKPAGDAVFAPGELPSARLVAPDSDDPEQIGLALEALQFHTPPMTPERQQKLDQMEAKTLAEIARRHTQETGEDNGEA